MTTVIQGYGILYDDGRVSSMDDINFLIGISFIENQAIISQKDVRNRIQKLDVDRKATRAKAGEP